MKMRTKTNDHVSHLFLKSFHNGKRKNHKGDAYRNSYSGNAHDGTGYSAFAIAANNTLRYKSCKIHLLRKITSGLIFEMKKDATLPYEIDFFYFPSRAIEL